MKVLISPHPCQHLLLCLILAVLVAMKWYFFIVFICSSLKTNAVEHLFMGLLIICTFSLDDVYSNLSPIFNWITSLYCWAIVHYIFFGYMIFKSLLDSWSYTWFANIYSYPVGCVFNCPMLFFETQSFEFWSPIYLIFFLCFLWFQCHSIA